MFKEIQYFSPKALVYLQKHFERIKFGPEKKFIIIKDEKSPVFQKDNNYLGYIYSKNAVDAMHKMFDKFCSLSFHYNQNNFRLTADFLLATSSIYTGSCTDKSSHFDEIKKFMSNYKNDQTLLSFPEFEIITSNKPINFSLQKFKNLNEAIPQIKDKNRLSELETIVATMK